MTSDAVRLRRFCSVRPGRLTSALPSMPGDPGDAICRPVLHQLRPVDFQDLDVDDELGPRLVERRDEPADGLQALGCVADGDRVGSRDRLNRPEVADDSQRVERLFQIGIANVERAQLFLRVFASLGRGVGHDDDRRRAGDLVEIAGGPRDGVERLAQRHVRQQAALRGRLPERRVERDRDVADRRDHHEQIAAGHGAADRDRSKIDVRQVGAGRREVPRALEERLQLCLAVGRHRELRAERLPHVLDLTFGVSVRRIQLGGQLQLEQRVVELALGVEAASVDQVAVGRAQLRALQTGDRLLIVRMLAHGPRVFRDGQVVVLRHVGLTRLGQRIGGAGGERHERGDREYARRTKESPHFRITSTSFGSLLKLKTKSASASPTFSLRFTNV